MTQAAAEAKRPVIVLLVEDNEAHAEMVNRLFEIQHVAHSVHIAQDGEQALNYLLRRGPYTDPAKSPRPDLVLLDLRLPRMDGLDLLRQIRDVPSFQDLPVVVLTSSDAEVDMAKAYLSQANSYLVKPLTIRQIEQMMHELGIHWAANGTEGP